ncbi:MAG: lipopolysaccharide biosynthesis protein [Cytophagales bacterium]|nr:MAG: lipopolysaccharide biosynthesis protein [Cytophagales bacterium]
MSDIGRTNTTLNDEELIEIRVSDIANFFKRNRRAMFIGGFVGLILGALFAFSKSNEYNSQVTVMPEIQGKAGGLGGLGSLAGLAGINIDNLSAGSDAIRPDLYPNVIQTVPFALNLLEQPVFSKEFKKTQTLDAFLSQHNAGNWANWFSGLFSSGSSEKQELLDPKHTIGALVITKHQDERVKEIQSRVTAQYDKKSGIIALSATMPDPVVAATVAKRTLDYLTNYAIAYRTEKARQQVEFLNRQVAASKRRYQEAEVTLSSYRDRNRSLFLNTAKIEEQRIQAEFMLAQDLYNNLSKQLEMAKIKVQEETPIFKTLEPVKVPLKKSGPKRTMIMAGFAVVGVVLALCINVAKQLSKPYR